MAQKNDTLLIENLLNDHPEVFKDVLNHPDHHQVQILYTQIDRDENNKPNFKSHSYRLDNKKYFYPASTVKLAAVIFALEKINELKVNGLTAESTMLTDSSLKGQTSVSNDTSAKNGLPSIFHYIKKILLTSDNDAFNRLFEFIGRAEINAKLKKYDFISSRILNRLSIGDVGESSKHTNQIRFYNGRKLIYTQAPAYDPREYPLELTNTTMGVGYLDNEEKLVNEPFSLENKNVFTISDQQSLMKKLIFPETFPKQKQFNLSETDYKLIYTYMSMLPTENTDPIYSTSEFWPYYSKMIFFGREQLNPKEPEIRVFNKYGDSYGFIIDNGYFVDFRNKVEFFLTAVVQSNEDGIYNDGKYEYETICYPFMKNLGRVIHQYELSRHRENTPDLSKFRIKY